MCKIADDFFKFDYEFKFAFQCADKFIWYFCNLPLNG